MLRLRSISPAALTVGALVLMVACELQESDPGSTVGTGSGAEDATSGTGATRPVGSSSSSGDQGGDPTRTDGVITMGAGSSHPGDGGAGGAGGAGSSSGAGGDPIYTCQTNNVCDVQDDCVCPDCSNHIVCTNPNNCENDGICKPFIEGCVCADCASLDICQP